jgi:hypothetical protein
MPTATNTISAAIRACMAATVAATVGGRQCPLTETASWLAPIRRAERLGVVAVALTE